MVQANAKVKRVSTKKLDDVISSQKTFSDKTGLGYTGESSLAVNISKEMKFVKTKELVVVSPIEEKANIEKKKNVVDQQVLNKPRNQSVVRFEARVKSLPRSQKGLRTNHVCHHCGLQGHTRPNCHKLRALRNAMIKGQEDQEMTRVLGLLSHQEIEMVIRNDGRDKDDWCIQQLLGKLH